MNQIYILTEDRVLRVCVCGMCIWNRECVSEENIVISA